MEPEDEIPEAFVYHAPTPEHIEKIQAVREALGRAAIVLKAQVPGCAEQTLALRHLEQASMYANKAIVFDGRRYL